MHLNFVTNIKSPMEIVKELSDIKKSFFGFRNGIVSSSLRNAGDPHRYIMGCLLPDIAQIARNYTPSVQLAECLWNEKQHRECRLAATMLYPIAELDFDTARNWCCDVETHEVADVLCMKLLRHYNRAQELAWMLLGEDNLMHQYTGLRLLTNLQAMERLTLSHDNRLWLLEYSEHSSSNHLKTLAFDLIIDE